MARRHHGSRDCRPLRELSLNCLYIWKIEISGLSTNYIFYELPSTPKMIIINRNFINKIIPKNNLPILKMTILIWKADKTCLWTWTGEKRRKLDINCIKQSQMLYCQFGNTAESVFYVLIRVQKAWFVLCTELF